MHKKKIGFIVIAIALLGLSYTLFGCSPNSTTPLIPLKTGEMNATISGFGSFNATNALAKDNSVYDIRASLDNDSLVIEMTVSKQAVVPYTIDVANDSYSKITYCVLQSDGSCHTYSADMLNGGSGQITITSLSPTLQGTFSGTLQLIGGSGTVNITGGEFNASF